MSEYFEKRKIVQAVPVGQPTTETHHAVVHERRGISGAEATALVLAAIACAVVITMLIMNTQQKNIDAEMAAERALANQQVPAEPSTTPMQPTLQPPPVVMPQSPALAPPVPAPVPSEPPAAASPTSAQLEVEITSRILDDSDLRSVPIDVRVTAGIATLSGQVSSEELKMRAERIAKRVKGVSGVINGITVATQP